MKTITLLLFALLSSLNIYGQQFSCGFDAARQHLLETDPSYREKEMNVNRLLQQRLHNQQARSTQTLLYIPIVVHVIHQNGPENLHDSVIINAVAELNHVFANTGSYYDPAGADIGIRFCLAS